MKSHNFFFTLATILCTFPISGYAQRVIVDKTTSEMRKIITSEVDWFGTGRDDKASLCYFATYGEEPSSYYILDVNWDEEGKSFQEGFKILFKHASGAFTELNCVLERSQYKERVKLIPFPLPSGDIYVHAFYQMTEEQVQAIITNPVVKIRIEYDKGYFDVDCARKDGTSRFSDYIKKAFDVIQTAKKNKTGLYDNF